jgi:hypothetical protein
MPGLQGKIKPPQQEFLGGRLGSLFCGGLTVSRVSLVLAGWRAIVADLPCTDDSLGWYGPIGPVGCICGIDYVDPSTRLGPGFCEQLGREAGGRNLGSLTPFPHTPFLLDGLAQT